jgi:hypothetical protein
MSNRLFGIVLVKLLMHGEAIDMELFKHNKLVTNLQCDKPSYRQLIDLCFDIRATAALVAGFIRSICLHELANWDPKFSDRGDGSRLIANIKRIYQLDKKIATLEAIGRLHDKGDRLIEILCSFLCETGVEVELQNHAIASLATISPERLMENKEVILQATGKLSDSDTFDRSIGDIMNVIYSPQVSKFLIS